MLIGGWRDVVIDEWKAGWMDGCILWIEIGSFALEKLSV